MHKRNCTFYLHFIISFFCLRFLPIVSWLGIKDSAVSGNKIRCDGSLLSWNDEIPSLQQREVVVRLGRQNVFVLGVISLADDHGVSMSLIFWACICHFQYQKYRSNLPFAKVFMFWTRACLELAWEKPTVANEIDPSRNSSIGE